MGGFGVVPREPAKFTRWRAAEPGPQPVTSTHRIAPRPTPSDSAKPPSLQGSLLTCLPRFSLAASLHSELGECPGRFTIESGRLSQHLGESRLFGQLVLV